jgi:hypothetical protein
MNVNAGLRLSVHREIPFRDALFYAFRQDIIIPLQFLHTRYVKITQPAGKMQKNGDEP